MEKANLLSKENIDNFNTRRNIINLYKSFLIILEDLEQEHSQHFNNLYDAFKDENNIIKQADYFTEEKLAYLRKKVLDAGNNCLRNILKE